MIAPLELSRKIHTGYKCIQKQVCKAYGIPETAMDILLFLANNPEYTSARDIVEVRNLKANLVSIHVDRLVRDGYLTRSEVPGDRRKHALALTEKAAPIVEAGREMQEKFFETMFSGISQAERETCFATLETIGKNMDAILKGTAK